MRITIAADHAGFELKQLLAEFLREQQHAVNDLGTNNTAAVDYPDFAEALALSIRHGDSERGILICGSGVGASVAANKIPGIRAGLC
ncbi:MAG TPA: RpiB/LacA/LacB family sugar-phosphate isomerase, partial [Verrucomicrobiae bacterium]|nr:RpiB/LacA/LacB family sugar-phosphate isomerase [Verrucomicrobiae bacterium]